MWNTAIILNVISLAIISAWFTLLLQWPVSQLVLRQLKQMPASWHKSMLIGWVLLPVCVAMLCSVAFILHAFTDLMWTSLALFIHWHHLFSFEWFTWHGCLLISWCAVSVWIVLRHVYELKKHRDSLRSAVLIAESRECTFQGHTFTRLETNIPLAFTAGGFRPRVYLSSGLIARFTPQQLHCILAHEVAHKTHRDPLQTWVFSLMSAWYPSALRREMRQAFELATEMKADAVAGRETGALNVASALVAYGKSDTRWQLPMVMGFGQHGVSLRVKNLIQPAKLNAHVPLVVSGTALAVLAANLLSMDSLHHYIELIIQF
ncbi:M56 family metallopeptidase [Paraglaciecola chathamensis]|uniref:Peptidase M48 domain-containing protein n=1 Tax=Paraglaciecola chathamensis S18K6 TaxID=1127672 RepID=A0AAV3UTN7_9ALTE|nr:MULTISPECIES: M56 family metallopeptidase [Paraglaciecola]MBN26427.1 hypothetical protein [Alteromonadaceae bacterium]GAC08328.1 hypothetical protein GCHA_0364 [Paraglaciecola chathamensis S18K6]|tara:strand:+ start:40982 stop:41938 length:957 start_codon:yes stop_codon:yes gene_type:complete